MNESHLPSSATTCLLFPPYERFYSPLEVTTCPDRGVAVVWMPRDAEKQAEERAWLAERPAGVGLVVMLPPPSEIKAALPLLRDVSALQPRGILPDGLLKTVEPVRLLLSASPRDMPDVVVTQLTRAGVLRSQEVRALVSRIVELAADVPSISKLSRKLYTSRRTLGRLFEAEGLPVPSHWLQFARLLHVSVLIQERRDLPIFKAALRVGYPDGFTMSNQMKRLIGHRPSEVREHLGYEWIIDEWLKREYKAGRLQVEWFGPRTFEVMKWIAMYPVMD